jgi:hypothetical protein
VWGDCQGQVLPTPENCASPADEDCDGHASSADGDTDCGCEPGTIQACYTGPPGTENVGICHTGDQICNSDGLGWGACQGDLTPATEDCATAQDEDCDNYGWFSDGDTDCACEPGTTQPCYEGSAGTENVGTCHGGTRTCNPNGLAFGECIGQVVPAAEVCGNAELDEDCNGALCGGDALWAIKAGGSGDQAVQDLAVDGNGNILIVGHFASTLTLGGTILTSQGGFDAFAAKLDTNGNVLWVSQFGGSSDQLAMSVAVDTAGNVIIAGHFDGSISVGGNTLITASAKDVFVFKLAPDGGLLWAKRFGDIGDQRAMGVAITGQDDVVLTGDFYSSINFGSNGSTNLTTNIFDTDIFVACLDSNLGEHIWSYSFGDLAEQRGRSIAAGNDVYVTGDVAGTFQIGGNTIMGGTHTDVLGMNLATLDGTPAWGWSVGDSSSQFPHQNEFGHDIAVDDAENVLLTGSFGGVVNFGGVDLTANGPSNGFVARFTAAGEHTWSKAFGDSDTLNLISHGVAVADEVGSVLLTGQFSGTADFGSGPVDSAGADDVFVTKLDPNGGHLWSRRFGDAAEQVGISVAADPAGNVLVAGYFSGTLDFNTGISLTANADVNGGDSKTLFVAKLSKDPPQAQP